MMNSKTNEDVLWTVDNTMLDTLIGAVSWAVSEAVIRAVCKPEYRDAVDNAVAGAAPKLSNLSKFLSCLEPE
jgi:L-aminopeptidase/D-esterase-like protein